MTPADRIRRALATRDAAEVEWALEHANARIESAPDENIANYWREIVRRLQNGPVS